jgi:hypothetical protein
MNGSMRSSRFSISNDLIHPLFTRIYEMINGNKKVLRMIMEESASFASAETVYEKYVLSRKIRKSA